MSARPSGAPRRAGRHADAALLALVCALATLPGPARAQEAPAEAGEPFQFVQMADPQFGFFASPLWLAARGYWGWRAGSFARESELYAQAIAAANALDPAFVVICGDLVNKPGHAGQRAEFQRISAGLDEGIPLHLVAGNHDVGNDPTPASLEAYRREFGRDWYSFRHGRMAGIVLDSQLFVAPEGVEDEARAQWDWLVAELARLRADDAAPILVFQHVPYFLEEPEEEDAYFNVPRARRARYLALLRENGVRAVLAGHLHDDAVARAGSLEMITTGPVGRPLGESPSGFRLVRVAGGEISHEYLPHFGR